MGIPPGATDASELTRLDAFSLFRERARSRVPDWDARSPAESTAVTEILRLVDGIPLAIELAAAWVGSKTLAEIRIGLSNRMDTLKRRGFSPTERHRSMRACLDYSFDLLSGDAKEIFTKLAVFAGGFYVEDVEAVCGVSDGGALLLSLHERNLVTRQEALDRSRYGTLGTIQEYAAEMLPDMAAKALGRAHARHFLEVLRAANQQLDGAGYVRALERIGLDLPNFEAGIRESGESADDKAVVGYAALLSDYLRIKGRHKARLTLALAARAAANNLGREVVAAAENNLGIVYTDLPTGDRPDNLQRAIECYEAALRVWTEQNSPQGWAMTKSNLGTAYIELQTGNRSDNLQRAIECFEAGLRSQDRARFSVRLGDNPAQPQPRLHRAADWQP